MNPERPKRDETNYYSQDKNAVIGLLRTILALAVIYFHSFVLTGKVDPLYIYGTDTGKIAVQLFFFLSGFLLIRKAIDLPFDEFMFRRIKRIFPGLFVFLLTCCILMIFLSILGIFHVATRDVFSWFYTNIDPINPNRMYTVNGVFSLNPVPQSVAGNLWTVTFEFWCYLFLAGGLSILKRLKFLKGRDQSLSLIMVSLVMYLHIFGTIRLGDEINVGSLDYFVYVLLPIFLFGCVCQIQLNKLRRFGQVIRVIFVASAIFAVYLIFHLEKYDEIGPYVLGTLLVFLVEIKRVPKIRIINYFKSHDIAFGVYLYSYPIQQLFWFLGARSNFVNFLLASTVSIILGHISYAKIESPWLRKNDPIK